jgi:predicted nucleic acid-binding protein
LSSTKAQYLLDVNVVIALLTEGHIHYDLVTDWFTQDPNLQWALCAYSEAGFLRYAIAPHSSYITLKEATVILTEFTRRPGYHYLPVTADWYTLCGAFLERIFGHKQITDAYLLGLALRENMVLVTLDKTILHLAGKYQDHVLLLGQEG